MGYSDTRKCERVARKVKLVLVGYEPIKGNAARRYRNIQTGETISRRAFATRARRVEVIQLPHVRETIKEQRLKWYTNYVNRQIWLEHGLPYEYVSQAEMSRSPEFNYYNDLVSSSYEGDREMAYEFWDEMEDIYANEDWGES